MARNNKVVTLSPEVTDFLARNPQINFSAEAEQHIRSKYMTIEWIDSRLKEIKAEEHQLLSMRAKLEADNASKYLTAEERKFFELEISVKGYRVKNQVSALWQRFVKQFPDTKLPEDLLTDCLNQLLSQKGEM